MSATSKFVVVIASCIVGFATVVRGQIVAESHAFADPNLLAAIFAPPPTRSANTYVPPQLDIRSEMPTTKHEIRLPYRKPPIPENWEAFDKQFAPEMQNKRSLQILENGLYEVNQTLYSIKLFERNVNSMLNFEYKLRELGGYDSRSRLNAIDGFFDHTTVRTDFNWDAPIGLYIGVRLQIKCDSIFAFWK